MNVRRSPSGTDFELKISADPVNTESVDRPQARPVLVMSFSVRHKEIEQFGYTPERQELNELMRTAECRDRIDREEEMRQDKRARVKVESGDGHGKPAEATNEDEQMEEGECLTDELGTERDDKSS